MGLPEELKAKRGELSGRARASGVLADLQAQIAAVDKGDRDLQAGKEGEQPQKRRGRSPTAMSAKELNRFISGTNKRQMALDSCGRPSGRRQWPSSMPASGHGEAAASGGRRNQRRMRIRLNMSRPDRFLAVG